MSDKMIEIIKRNNDSFIQYYKYHGLKDTLAMIDLFYGNCTVAEKSQD